LRCLDPLSPFDAWIPQGGRLNSPGLVFLPRLSALDDLSSSPPLDVLHCFTRQCVISCSDPEEILSLKVVSSMGVGMVRKSLKSPSSSPRLAWELVQFPFLPQPSFFFWRCSPTFFVRRTRSLFLRYLLTTPLEGSVPPSLKPDIFPCCCFFFSFPTWASCRRRKRTFFLSPLPNRPALFPDPNSSAISFWMLRFGRAGTTQLHFESGIVLKVRLLLFRMKSPCQAPGLYRLRSTFNPRYQKPFQLLLTIVE